MPAELLLEHLNLFTEGKLPGPVLDLASGDCHNGIFLAGHNLSVVCWDKSPEALARARQLAAEKGVSIECRQVDLERQGINPLPEDHYGGILIFHYLHRPLLHCIRKSLKTGGILVYETFTIHQSPFGKPHNPDHLLHPGELKTWFADWEIIHYFEGVKDRPKRAVAQIVCRKGA